MVISLSDFDKSFFQTIDGHEKIRFVSKGIYHIILIDDKKAGVVGYIPTQNSKGEKLNFVQIVLCPEFRGKRITKLAEDLLAKTYKLPNLYATIDNDNIASLKAHKKADFKELNLKTINALQKNGFLQAKQTRLRKIYHLF